MWNGQ